MGQRLGLHEQLVSALGTRNVYFQPPSTLRMTYPCIIYSLYSIDTKFADDMIYQGKKSYLVTIVDPNPDSTVIDKLLSFPLSSFDRHYVADNLNHDVFIIYF